MRMNSIKKVTRKPSIKKPKVKKYVDIPLDMPNDLLLALCLDAHKNDRTLNDEFNIVLQCAIDNCDDLIKALKLKKRRSKK